MKENNEGEAFGCGCLTGLVIATAVSLLTIVLTLHVTVIWR